MLKRIFTYRKIGKQLCIVGLASLAFGVSQSVQADSWRANQPDQIELSSGQQTYAVKKGDTLWAIAQKANLTVATLADYNQIDLAKGEERFLKIGQVLWLVPRHGLIKTTNQTDVALKSGNLGTGTVDSTVQVLKKNVTGLTGLVTPDTGNRDDALKGTADDNESKATEDSVKETTSDFVDGMTDSAAPDTGNRDDVLKGTTDDNESKATEDSVKETTSDFVEGVTDSAAPDTGNRDDALKGTTDDNESKATENSLEENPLINGAVTDNEQSPSQVKVVTENGLIVSIENQEQLNAYLLQTGYDLSGDKIHFKNKSPLVFKKGTYYLTESSTWYFGKDSVGNIDFSDSTFAIGNNTRLAWEMTGDHQNQQISNATFYGSVIEDTKEDGSILRPENWENGNFNADLIHTSNIGFKNLSFKNSQQTNDHIFDVIGSNNIVFDGITVAGYGGKKLSQEEIKRRYQNNRHQVLAEAIQIDASNRGASGYQDLSDTVLWNNQMNDGKASSDIEIKNSTFTSYKGVSGQSIIDNSSEIVERNYGSTIGGHSKSSSDDGYQNISVHDNTFKDTIYVEKTVDTTTYPVHFNVESTSTSQQATISVENNTFINQGTYANGNYGQVTNGYIGYYGTSSGGEDNNIKIKDSATGSVDMAEESVQQLQTQLNN